MLLLLSSIYVSFFSFVVDSSCWCIEGELLLLLLLLKSHELGRKEGRKKKNEQRDKEWEIKKKGPVLINMLQYNQGTNKNGQTLDLRGELASTAILEAALLALAAATAPVLMAVESASSKIAIVKKIFIKNTSRTIIIFFCQASTLQLEHTLGKTHKHKG